MTFTSQISSSHFRAQVLVIACVLITLAFFKGGAFSAALVAISLDEEIFSCLGASQYAWLQFNQTGTGSARNDDWLVWAACRVQRAVDYERYS